MTAASLALCVLIPLLGSIGAFVLGRRGAAVALPAAVLTFAAASLAVGAVWADGPRELALGDWQVPLGIRLEADGLSASMLGLTALVALVAGLHAWSSLPSGPPGDALWTERDGFWPLWLFAWAALNALFLTRDIFNAYVALELLTLAGVGLAILDGKTAALIAGMRYLLAALLGSLAFLLGVALLYGAFGTLDFGLLGERMSPGAATWAALGLILAGLAIKGALFPLHLWLPAAHASAPAPASALLSGLVVKAGFYLSLRLLLDVFPAVVTLSVGQLLGALGAAALAFGSLQALRQERLKLLIAYSTVAQIGYLFIAIAIAMAPYADGEAAWEIGAWGGGVYYALAHGCAKAAMFLAAGNVVLAIGHDRVRDLSGVAAVLPVSSLAFALAGMTLMGLPPSGGFTGKFLMIEAAIDAGWWWWALVLVAGAPLAAAYLLPVARAALSPLREGSTRRPVPRAMEASALGLALAAVALGFSSGAPLELLRGGGGTP